jgi:hypothetical protein
MDASNLLAITLKKKLKIKEAKWGTPKKIFKKRKVMGYLNSEHLK